MAMNRNGSSNHGRRSHTVKPSPGLTETLSNFAHEKAGELNEAAHDQVGVWQEELEAKICEKPLKSVLIAAGIGLAFGLFWRR